MVNRKKFFTVFLVLATIILMMLSTGISTAATTNVAAGILPTCSGAINGASLTTDGNTDTAY